MNKLYALGLGKLTTLAVAALLAACATEAAGDAPEAMLDGVDELDEGTTWNFMTQMTFGTHSGASVQAAQTFTFPYQGSDSRGGGFCIAVKEGSSCTDDATSCLGAARAKFGTSAYGYCYQGQCYERPGAPPTFCVQGSARPTTKNSPNTVLKAATIPSSVYDPFGGVGYLDGRVATIGCMTKAGAPSTDCNSTNSSLYMRTASLSGAGSDPLCDDTYTISWNGSVCFENYSRVCSDGSTASGNRSAAPNGQVVGWGNPAVQGIYSCDASDNGYTWKVRHFKSEGTYNDGNHSW